MSGKIRRTDQSAINNQSYRSYGMGEPKEDPITKRKHITMNEIVIKQDLSLVNDDELVMSYILTQKEIPALEEKIVAELLKRNIDGKGVMLNGTYYFLTKQPTEKMIDSKLNNTKKIIKHCLVNDINEL
jgi:hypothetical protein